MRGNNIRGNGPKSGVLSFGNINSGWTDFDSGFVFGIWYPGAGNGGFGEFKNGWNLGVSARASGMAWGPSSNRFCLFP